MDYNNYPPQYQYAQPVDETSRVSAVMKRVYVNMTAGLLITALVAWICQSTPGFGQWVAMNSWFMWLMIIAEFAIVIGVGAGINRLSTPVASFLFFLFAAINGAGLYPIFLVYTQTSIVKTFLICAATFAAMSVYGFCTNRDLSRWGSLLFMALIGLIIASLANIFIKSTGFMWVLTFAGVLIFVGLTAWDTQQIKRMALMAPSASIGRLAVLGALSLYLDFINLFLYLLRIFGNSRD